MRLETAKQKLDSLLKESNSHIDVMQGLAAELFTGTNYVEQQSSDGREVIEQEYEKFLKKLNTDRDELLNQLEEMENKQCGPLKEYQQKAANWMEGMKNIQGIAKMILEEDNQWNILTMEMNIVSAFEQLRDDMFIYSKRIHAARDDIKKQVVRVPVMIKTGSAKSDRMPFPPTGNLLGKITYHGMNVFYISKTSESEDLVYQTFVRPIKK